MNDTLQQLRGYVRMVWPYRWTALAAAAVVCALGWAYVYSLPNVYQVSAKIFIDTRSMLRPLLKGLAVDNRVLEDSALLMRQTLLTRPNLEEVARRTDLDLEAKTPREFDTLMVELSERLKVTGTQRDNIYEITFEDSDARLAKKLVDELLNTFLESTLGDTRKDTAVTQKFLDQQIAEYERKLIEAEERLKEFKRKNVAVMPGTGEDYYTKLQSNESVLAQARLELQEAQRRRDELARQVEGEEPIVGLVTQDSMTSPVLSQIEGRMEALRSRLDQLQLNYTEKHPDVVAAKESMASLEKERDAELQRIATAGPAEQPGLAENPIYQEMRVQLGSAQAEVAALSSRVAEYERRSKELQKLVNTVPEIEAEMQRLDRDYGLNKEQYEELIKRRESARISEEAEKSADDIKLKVIEPPRVPLVPSGPNRIQLSSMVLVAGLGLGGGLAFLMSQIFPRFYTTQALKEYTGIPVIGSITMVISARKRRERHMEYAFFGVMLLMLLSLYGSLVAMGLLNIDLHGHLRSLLGALV